MAREIIHKKLPTTLKLPVQVGIWFLDIFLTSGGFTYNETEPMAFPLTGPLLPLQPVWEPHSGAHHSPGENASEIGRAHV